MVNFLGKNLKYLREQQKLSLVSMSELVDIKKNTINNYENEVSEPNLGILISLSQFFGHSVDDLLNIDLSQNRGLEGEQATTLVQKRGKPDKTTKKSSIVTVDTSDNSVVPILDVKVSAGSPTMLDEPDYYKELPSLTFPNYFFRGGALVSIPVRGDSMMPTIKQGDYVIGKELEVLAELNSGEVYIIIHQLDQLVQFTVKRCYYFAGDEAITLQSDNTDYLTDQLPVSAILKVYHVQACLTKQLYKAESSVKGHLERIEKRIERLENRIKE